jgi:seryl-tRNA synthetase
MVLTKKVKGGLVTAFVMAYICFGQPAFPQGAIASPGESQQQAKGFSDDELKQFVQASAKVMSLQQRSQEAMVAAIEREKLSIDRFNQIARAHQQQKLEEVRATPEEIAAFNKAVQKIMEMQPEVEKEVQQTIEEEIPVDKYQKIMLAYQQNPAVQAKVNKILQKQE